MTMDTETRLVATQEQVRNFIKVLTVALEASSRQGMNVYAEATLEQLNYSGPWRIIIGVRPE